MQKSKIGSHKSTEIAPGGHVDKGGKLRGKRDEIGVKRLTVDITEANHDKLKRFCFENDTTFVRVIDALIEKHL